MSGATQPAGASEPIRFRGREFANVKNFWSGTQRIVSPEETIARVRPHYARLGLTRLANITGLDRIGIPTILSVRPNSPFLSVDAGKGFTVAAATASAVMECVERYHGETTPLAEWRASYASVVREHAVMPLADLPLARSAHFTSSLPISWALGWDLMQQREVAAPTMMVRLDRSRMLERQPVPFQTGSNGLAAGNDFLEALDGGLLELVERDAVTCHRMAWDRARIDVPRVRLETVEHPAARELLERFERADVGVVLFDCTVDTGVPTYMAYVYDRVLRHIGIYRGYGAHLEPGIAMVRALTEAVQARLIFIAGSRDDFFRHDYLKLKQGDDAASIRYLESVPANVDARERQSLATPSFEGDVHLILDRLRQVGIEHVIVYDLTQPGFDVAAVRVLVPGLEGYVFDYYTPGRRARAFIERRKAEVGRS